MKKLFVLLIKFSVPILLVIAIYVWLDPFKVVHHYDSYFEPYTKASIPLNKDYVSTANYGNRYKGELYDSFIFGNSRSMVFEKAVWQKYIGILSKPYHFDAANETLFGICRKILYIDEKKQKIKNVLLVMDRQLLLQTKSNEGHLFVISPQLVNYNNLATFHITAMRDFMSYDFLPGYADYKLSGKVKPYMTRTMLDGIAYTYDATANEMIMADTEKSITEGSYYSTEQMKVFYARGKMQKVSDACIGSEQQLLLQKISAVLKSHGTNVKVIINPLYNQEKLNPKDIAYLEEVFGTAAVFDFSGINDITNDYSNYYETSHYRPQVANKILAKIYGRK